MKKTLFLICMLLAGWNLRLNAQSPACLAGKLTPVPKPAGYDIDTIVSGPQGEKWFKFPIINDNVTVRLSSFLTGIGYRTDKIELYKGSNCTSLTLLDKDSLGGVSDSLFKVGADSLLLSDTIFLRTTCISNSYCSGCGNSNMKFELMVQFDPGDPHNCYTCTTMTGCNLVCNGDFEQHNPNGVGLMYSNITEACGWSDGTGGTCDYLSTSVPATYVTSAPCNIFGYEQPHSGQGYAGFQNIASATNQNNPNGYWEYMKTQLLLPLVANQTYTVSFWLSQAEQSKLKSNTIGVYLFDNPSNISISGIGQVTNAPTYTCNTSALSTSGWTQYSFPYTPTTGNIQWLMIGSFTTAWSQVSCQTNVGSCSGYACDWTSYIFVDDISVTGPIITTHTVTGCAGSSHTLTSTLNSPWSWSGPGGTTGTTQSITTTYGTLWPSTPFIVTGTTPSGCAAQEQFYVSGIYPNETITVTPGPATPACAGQPITFTASGLSSNNYTWYTTPFSYWVLPPPVAAAGTGSTFTYTPGSSPASQTLLVYGTAQNGCGELGSTVINIIPSVSAVISGSQSMCSQSNNINTYTATPQAAGVTYTWSVTCNGSNVPFTTAPNGQSITVDWTSYTSGTVNAQVCLTVSAPGCTSSNTCVQVAPCCKPSTSYITVAGNTDPNNPTAITSSTFSTGGSYALSGYYTISGVVSWSNIRFAMAPGTKITIPSATPVNNKLTMTECHFFGCSKMWDGIYVDGGLLQTSTNKKNLFEDAVNAIVLLNGTNPGPLTSLYFNKCHIGIDFRATATTNTTVIAKCVFTSRDFGINTAGANLTSTYLGTGTGATSIPDNYPTSNYAHYTSANMLAPYAGARGTIGVNIADNAQVTVGYTSTLATDRNIFDNLFFGIFGTNSNVFVINNLFIYIQECGCREAAGICPSGAAICTGNTISTQTSSPKFTKAGVASNGSVYKNYFESDQYGIYNTVNRSLDARNNDFKIIDKVAIYNDMGSNYLNNFPNTYPANVMNILNNTMDQAQTGIQLKDNRNALMIVKDNTINWANYPTAPTATTQQSVSGIIVENAVAHTAGSLYVNTNKLANLQKGITLTLQGYNGTGTSNRVQVFRNPIYFNQLQTSTVSTQHYGIGIFSCKRVTVDGDGATAEIVRAISSPSTPALLNTAAQRELFSGIRVESSTETWITDMNITQTPGGIYVKNVCSSSDFWCNTLTSTFNGFYFNNATIGNQLNLASPYNGAPTGNQWVTPVAAGSKLAGTITPSITWFYNSGAGPNANPLPSGLTVGSASITASDNPNDPCNFQLEPEDPPIDPEMRTGTVGPKVFETGNSPGKQFEAQQNQVTGSSNQRESEEGPSLELYPAYLDSMGTAAASQYNSEIAVSTAADIARKQVDAIHLNSWAQGTSIFRSTDSTYLCNLAAEDPAVFGSAVYSAIVMVGDCETLEMETERKTQIQATEKLTESKQMIYPNPNNGLMQADILLKENENGTLDIFDLSGVKLSAYGLKAGNNTFTIDESKLSAGIYIYHIVVNGKTIQSQKLVIIK
jgi:hypothetical protein